MDYDYLSNHEFNAYLDFKNRPSSSRIVACHGQIHP